MLFYWGREGTSDGLRFQLCKDAYTKDGGAKEGKRLVQERKENAPNFLNKVLLSHSQTPAGLSCMQIRTDYMSLSRTQRNWFREGQFAPQVQPRPLTALKPYCVLSLLFSSISASADWKQNTFGCCGYSVKLRCEVFSRTPAPSSCSEKLALAVTVSGGIVQLWGAGLWM